MRMFVPNSTNCRGFLGAVQETSRSESAEKEGLDTSEVLWGMMDA